MSKFPTSCGLLKFCLISQRDLSSLASSASFSSVAAPQLHHPPVSICTLWMERVSTSMQVNHDVEYTIQRKTNSFYCSIHLPVWLRLFWCWSPVDGTAAKSSRYAATNFTCQLQLPKEKVQMYLFHPGSEGFFQLLCSGARCSVCDTRREYQ